MHWIKARARVIALLVASAPAGSISWTSVASATGSDEAFAAALRKFDAGRQAYEGGQFEEALNDFKSSLELLPSPNTRMYIGRCYRALGKTGSAYTTLKLAAREAEDRLTASGEKRYAATRDTAKNEAADLEAKVPRLLVAVPSNPPSDLVIRVDGQELPQAAWGVATETDPGKVVVEASGHRLAPFNTTVTLKEGAHERVDVPLSRVPTATVEVKLKTLPAGLSLTLDGQPLPTSGADTPHEVDVGDHELTASAPGYVSFKWSKALADTEIQTVEVSLTPRPLPGSGGTPPWLFFTVGGVALASIGAGAGFALHAQSQQNQQLALNPYLRDPSIKSSVQQQATWTDILFVGGGVLGAGAVVLAISTRWKSGEAPPPAVSVAPWISPAGGGVGARGRF